MYLEMFKTLNYPAWCRRHEPGERELRRQRECALKRRPLISLLTTAGSVSPRRLEHLYRSLQRQTYTTWEWCLALGDVTPQARERLETWRAGHPRIRFVEVEDGTSEAAAAQRALALATGDWVARVRPDDELAPFALFEVARRLQGSAAPEVLYGDEDWILSGRRTGHFFKPDYSPDLLLSMNYIGGPVWVRRSLAKRLGFREGFGTAEGYDFTLRAVEKARGVGHLPRVLCHHRGEASSSPNREREDEAGSRRALSETLRRRGIAGRVEAGAYPGSFRARRSILGSPLVSIIIPFKDKPALLKQCVDSILEKSTYPRFELILLSNNSTDPEVFGLMSAYAKRPNVRAVEYNRPFNYSELNNYGARLARGEQLLLLNNDTEVLSPGWIEALLEHSQRPEVGAVGAKLYFPDKRLQHVGVLSGIGGVADHPYRFKSHGEAGYHGAASVVRNVTVVTGACLMIKRRLYLKVGGLEERLRVAFNDVDFCLRLHEKGFWNLYTPFAELYHHESITRGVEDNEEKRRRLQGEMDFIKRRHRALLRRGDPFYNPNLSYVSFELSYRLRK
jgi:GT2 family glycosyltransferase